MRHFVFLNSRRMAAGLLIVGVLAVAARAGTPTVSHAYVANSISGTVSVIDMATDQVTNTIPVGRHPVGIAVSPDGSQVYVANFLSGTVSVIDTVTDKVTGTIHVGASPVGIAVSPGRTGSGPP